MTLPILPFVPSSGLPVRSGAERYGPLPPNQVSGGGDQGSVSGRTSGDDTTWRGGFGGVDSRA